MVSFTSLQWFVKSVIKPVIVDIWLNIGILENLHIIYYYLKYHVVNCSSSISSNFLVSLSSSGTRERTDPVPVLPLRTDANRLFLMLYLLFLLKSSTCFLFSRLKKPHCWKNMNHYIRFTVFLYSLQKFSKV